jgi:hypothetical protein
MVTFTGCSVITGETHEQGFTVTETWLEQEVVPSLIVAI